jgi:hypothetical protein
MEFVTVEQRSVSEIDRGPDKPAAAGYRIPGGVHGILEF